MDDLTVGQLMAAAAIVAIHGPPDTRQGLAAALVAAVESLPAPNPTPTPESDPIEGEPR